MIKQELRTLGAVYIYIYISRLLDKNNNKINRIEKNNKITIKPKN